MQAKFDRDGVRFKAEQLCGNKKGVPVLSDFGRLHANIVTCYTYAVRLIVAVFFGYSCEICR